MRAVWFDRASTGANYSMVLICWGGRMDGDYVRLSTGTRVVTFSGARYVLAIRRTSAHPAGQPCLKWEPADEPTGWDGAW
jgi:hypothetical protein